MEKRIDLAPLCEMGWGRAYITDSLVEIEVGGISGGMKAWLIGGEAVPVGNIVDGKLIKKIDTGKHNGILITQSGRQMLLGKYAEEEEEIPALKREPIAEETEPEKIDGIIWKKKTLPNFSGLCRELRFILSNKSVYENYKRHRCYWAGENETVAALAMPREENGENPLAFLGKTVKETKGYSLICVDRNTKRLFQPGEN